MKKIFNKIQDFYLQTDILESISYFIFILILVLPLIAACAYLLGLITVAKVLIYVEGFILLPIKVILILTMLILS